MSSGVTLVSLDMVSLDSRKTRKKDVLGLVDFAEEYALAALAALHELFPHEPLLELFTIFEPDFNVSIK